MCAEYGLAPATVGQVFRTVAEYRNTRFNRFLSSNQQCIELSWRFFSRRKPPAVFN